MATKRAVLVETLAALAFVAAAAAGQDPVTRVSVDSSGAQGNGKSSASDAPAVSGDGRYVAFDSVATNLVGSDNNHHSDVFVHDRASGATVRVSVDSSGAEGNGDSFGPSLSGTGRYVVFWSLANNLIASDTNGFADVFLQDRDPDGNGIFDEGNGVTSILSVSTSGTQGNGDSEGGSISSDGTLIAFWSDATNLIASDRNSAADVFVRNLTTGKTTRSSVSSTGTEGNGNSYWPVFSADGSTIAFESFASNLVASDGNGVFDAFVRDRVLATTERVSVDSSGAEGNAASYLPSISSNGSVVAFESYASNLVANDTNGYADVFVRDRVAGATTRASVDSAGNEGDFSSYGPAISGDGRIVAFWTFANDLVANDSNLASDVLVHDQSSGATTAASDTCSGILGDGDSSFPAVSSDGRLVAFGSDATNLVASDTNGVTDAFVHDRSLDAQASWTNYGAGFPGTLGVPSLTASAAPAFGSSFTVDVGNSLGAPTVGLLLVGLQRASILTNSGGTILVDFLAAFPLGIGANGLSLPATIPPDDSLCGVAVDLQTIELDPGAAKRLSFTPGLELVIGL